MIHINISLDIPLLGRNRRCGVGTQWRLWDGCLFQCDHVSYCRWGLAECQLWRGTQHVPLVGWTTVAIWCMWAPIGLQAFD